ncbi:NEK1 [Bugula neritina]|uniref:non-specific serine/threonine protein kinase n=1 Tax=Bugula neritina TaxID=10212 RepID=A0A7J7J4R6_BUGNE|nr:NEK1 [Bugula neritina]
MKFHLVNLLVFFTEIGKMDKYKEIVLLGGGMFGKAYLHEYEKNGKTNQCAIKKIPVSSVQPELQASALREIEVLKKLHHPGIVKYIESFMHTGDICIVMEYCESGDLEKKINAQQSVPFPEEQVWDWFIQLCLAIKYLHGKRVMHRDLKPNNIFLTKDNTLKVGDFGLSKVSECYGAMNQTFAGAIGFCAPEVMAEEPYSSKCDMFSLGCVLYNIMMLRPPFVAKNVYAMMILVKEGRYTQVSPNYSQPLRSMVIRLLNVDQRERPSITQVMNDDTVRAKAKPEERLRRVYQHQLNNGVLLDNQGNGFVFDHYLNSIRDNNQRFDGLAEIFEAFLYDEMMNMGLIKLPVPVESTGNPDYDSPGSFIFATENWRYCERLMILIHGSGNVRAGQWTQRLMISGSLDQGTQLPYIRKAKECNYEVIVLNTNDNQSDTAGCRSPRDHGEYVWTHYITKCTAKQIAIKSHSAGGSVVAHLLSKFEDDFQNRVRANAFTGDCCLFGKKMQPFVHSATKSWIVSDKNLGTPLPSNGCECASAGTREHRETPHKAFEPVFKFIAEKFGDGV